MLKAFPDVIINTPEENETTYLMLVEVREPDTDNLTQ